MRKIMILNQDSGYLMIDIANAFNNAKYKVSLITGRLVKHNILLQDSICLYRVPEYKKNNIYIQFASSVFAFIKMIFLVWTKSKGSHLLIVTNPPFTPLIPFFVRNSFSLIFYDIYIESPANFLPCGKKSIMSKLWVWLHEKSLKKAKTIYTLTEGMKENLQKFIDNNKTITVVPIWTNSDFLKPIPKADNIFVKTNNLENKLIVMYSGTLGISNELEILLDVAKKIKNKNVEFLIVGEGTGKIALEKKGEELKLKNLKFLEWQPSEMLPYSLAAADIAVVTLSRSNESNSIPSKFFNYLAVGAPILSIAPESSELVNLIDKYRVGKNFGNPHVNDIIDFIELLSDEKTHRGYSARSLKAANDFTNINAEIFIEKLNY